MAHPKPPTFAKLDVPSVVADVGSKNPISGALQGYNQRQFTDGEVKEAFETFDLDNNNFVGAAEIKHILALIGEKASDDEIDEMIRMCDADGDGQVTFDEFYKLMNNPYQDRPVPDKPPLALMQTLQKLSHVAPAETAETAVPQSRVAEVLQDVITQLAGGGRMKPSHIKKIYKSFQAVDKDGSGYVDYVEFLEVLKQKDTPILKEVFKCFDLDFNGTVELKEFVTVLSGFTTATKTDKLKFAFMMFDEDGSGKLERQEMERILRANFMTAAISPAETQRKVDAIYQCLGLNVGGPISYEQFMELSKTKMHLLYPIAPVAFTVPGEEGSP